MQLNKSTRVDLVCLSLLEATDGLPVAVKYAVNFLKNKDVESVLLRLDRLTFEESRATVAQTLEVVYGLVQSMNVVMDGAQGRFA